MAIIRKWLCLAVAGMVLGTATAALAASDVKKVEHAVSGAAHRVSKGYHKQLKDYHIRQARHHARKGRYGKAINEAEKANWHANAEQKQLHRAHVKEKAVKHD
jgi:hypothetical protein